MIKRNENRDVDRSSYLKARKQALLERRRIRRFEKNFEYGNEFLPFCQHASQCRIFWKRANKMRFFLNSLARCGRLVIVSKKGAVSAHGGGVRMISTSFVAAKHPLKEAERHKVTLTLDSLSYVVFSSQHFHRQILLSYNRMLLNLFRWKSHTENNWIDDSR